MEDKNILEKFREFGKVEDEDLEDAFRRKEELEKSTSMIKMSEQTENDLRKYAVRTGIIPNDYINARFKPEIIRKNITEQQNMTGHKFKVENFNEYCEVCNSIINTVNMGKLPDRSYLIGAPNNFGKNSFATDCLLASIHNGWLTVPYISLVELADIKLENDKATMHGLMGIGTRSSKQKMDYGTGKYYDPEPNDLYTEGLTSSNFMEFKLPNVIKGRYSWSEYINAPLLVCFFSGIQSKAVESEMIYSLLNIRGAKGFPTIALISTPLDLYKKDPYLGPTVWKEIMAYSSTDVSKDRLNYIATYKNYNKL